MGLWSGDWEREADPFDPPAPTESGPEPAPQESPARAVRRGPVVLIVLAIVVLAVVVRAATTHHRGATVASRAVPTATPVPTAPPGHADALGLVLATAPGGRVLVRSVAADSPVRSVGVSAGDDLLSVNGHPVASPAQVETILARLPLGTQLTMQLAHGPEQITAQLQEPGVP